MLRFVFSVVASMVVCGGALAGEWPNLDFAMSNAGVGEYDSAVVVGISDYLQVEDIPGAVDNAQDWRDFFLSRGVAPANLHFLRDADATREAILREAAQGAATVAPSGRLWFVFVGHGAPMLDGSDGLLVGADAQATALSLVARSVRRDELLDVLGQAQSRSTVVLLDACFSGRTSSAAPMLNGLQPVVPLALRSSDRVTVFSAGRADQVAGPLPGLGRPAFSYLFLGGLRGWADRNMDGDISGVEAVEYASGTLSYLVSDRVQQPSASGPDVTSILSSGTESGPDIVAIGEELWRRELRTQVAGGSTSALADIRQRVVARQCQSEADAAVEDMQVKLLEQQVADLERQLFAEWAELEATARQCGRSSDVDLRRECHEVVRAFRGDLEHRVVARVPDIERSVDTPCGLMRGVALGREVDVAMGVRRDADELLERYSDTLELGIGGVRNQDVWSPTLGVLRWVPSGRYTMGSAPRERGRDADEPLHEVEITTGFWMMEVEVTQKMWLRVMGVNPSFFESCGADCPVERVSWNDAVAFAHRVSEIEGVEYRMPTEAEWEYAARGAEDYPYAGGRKVRRLGWVASNSGGSTQPGCRKQPNGFGLCDMTGNVWEWTLDVYAPYPAERQVDPIVTAPGEERVFRGGSWNYYAELARVANRGRGRADEPSISVGLRLVLDSGAWAALESRPE